MQTFLSLVFIGLLVVACQPQTKPAANSAATVSEAVAEPIRKGFMLPPDSISGWGASVARGGKVLPPDSMPPIPVRHGIVLRNDIHSQPVSDSGEIRHFFASHNLAPLLQTVKSGQYDYALNGFLGPDRYRTEVVITAAHQNRHNPHAYTLRGLTRTKRIIRPIQGEIIFDSLSIEPMLTARDEQDISNWTVVSVVRLDNDKTFRRYAVTGSVRLSEGRSGTQSAMFRGRVVMELELTQKGRLNVDAPFLYGPSRGAGQLYAGTWTNTQTGKAIPAIWVSNIVGYGQFIYSDFIVGERDVAINPKYAKLGWNELWENDEWWAKSPKPKLSL